MAKLNKHPHKQKDIELKIIEVGEMTDAQADVIASIYFTWWKRRYEQEMAEEAEKKKLQESADSPAG